MAEAKTYAAEFKEQAVKLAGEGICICEKMLKVHN